MHFIRPHSGYLSLMLAATILVTGCSTLYGDRSHEVSGQALYRERMIVPADSRLEVRLQDVSRADAPAVILDRVVRDNIASPPYPFSFKVAADQLQPGHSYSVSARITHNDRLLFITDSRYRVLAGEKDTDLMLVMKKVNEESTQARLQNTYWKLTALNGAVIELDKEQREPHLILKQGDRVQGFSGCNQFMGQFTQTENSLYFGPIAGTMRACVPSIDYEHRFLQLLQGEVNWSIDGEQLHLSNPANDLRATFQAVYLK
ncbi:YbaY family lipoprotein [Marinobacterium sediminicola]|uniref:Lipoprotein n=1 Tax=Marinobacterium sediminicola TaxID=518898 RepID=A0ABY1S1V9_9GAMM|nr:YbaY family lipoprotein [Marinobacterium sediminicola]ULG69760.1 YbaY family lipoprotein [Marinobacterium sediminicola]SMR75430.1 putative lipoprotein [Marinobacterium sediminicola]